MKMKIFVLIMVYSFAGGSIAHSKEREIHSESYSARKGHQDDFGRHPEIELKGSHLGGLLSDDDTITETRQRNSRIVPQPQSKTAEMPLPNSSTLNISDNKAQSVKYEISRGSQKFMLELFKATADVFLDQDVNFMISPFSIWSLMLLLAEGASGRSLDQLQRVLELQQNMTHLRMTYGSVQRSLKMKSSAIELDVNHALIHDEKDRQIKEEYRRIIENGYNADFLSVNFREPRDAAKAINEYIRLQTHGKILKFLEATDLTDVQLLLTSANVFKGTWKYPFNIGRTTNEPFLRSNGEPIGNVPTMHQRSFLPFAIFPTMKASILELPYGDEDHICMWLMLPFFDTTATEVLQNFLQLDIANINHTLHKYDSQPDYEPNEVILSLPRFKIESNLDLSGVLQHLNISDVFDPSKANLSNISNQSSYISRIAHKSVIEVNEAGTIAAAVAGATVTFKQLPTEFKFNRPFNFMIVDRSTHALLFSGQVNDPLK